MATTNASTDRTEVDPHTALEELLANAAAVAETLMHDGTVPKCAANSAWVMLEIIERAQVAHSRLWPSFERTHARAAARAGT